MNKNKDFWYEDTLKTMKSVLGEKEIYEIELQDKKIKIYPGVFSPKYFADAQWFAKVVPKQVGSGSFLEIGVGTGIISLFVGLNGASRVVASDINPLAVDNTQENFTLHHQKADLYVSDVFDSIPEEEFDVVFWNHPFNNVDFEVADPLMASVLDTNFRGLRKFFEGAKKYVKPTGKLLLGSGELADQELVEAIARDNDWKKVGTESFQSPSRVGGDVPMELFVHEFMRA